jgi:hypothetical protein
LIFGDKTCVLQDGSLMLGANDPPVYWDHTICCELLESDQYKTKIDSYENELRQYFRHIDICQQVDTEQLSRAHTYLYHLIQLNHHLRLNHDHDAHGKYSWKNFDLIINPFSSEPSLTSSGSFQVNAYDATMDILDFMINSRDQVAEIKHTYEIETKTEQYLCDAVRRQFHLTDILIHRHLRKQDVIQCCQRLLDQHEHLHKLLNKCRLKININYNLAQNGTISIPWNWSFAHEETV